MLLNGTITDHGRVPQISVQVLDLVSIDVAKLRIAPHAGIHDVPTQHVLPDVRPLAYVQ